MYRPRWTPCPQRKPAQMAYHLPSLAWTAVGDRWVDRNWGGTAVTDMGAYDYQLLQIFTPVIIKP